MVEKLDYAKDPTKGNKSMEDSKWQTTLKTFITDLGSQHFTEIKLKAHIWDEFLNILLVNL